jgi:hypothetical protein
MKLILENGKEYDAAFRHKRYNSGKRVTELALSYQSTSFSTVTYGLAECHPNDRFIKSYGRKLALKRAIAGLPREERAQIWAAYFRAIGGVK